MALILRLIISRWRWKFMRKFMVNSGNYYITNQVLKTQKIKHRNRMSFPKQFKPSSRWNIHGLSKIPFTLADRPVWHMTVASQSINPWTFHFGGLIWTWSNSIRSCSCQNILENILNFTYFTYLNKFLGFSVDG